MNFSVKKLERPDAQAYKNFRFRAFQESSLSFSESIEDEKHQPMEYFLGCMGESPEHFSVGCFNDHSQLVGVATFKRDKRSKARHKSYIHTMFTAPEFRGSGVASRILKQIIGEAQTMTGLEQIHLWVLNPQSSVATRLYEKAGFVTQGMIVKKDLKIDGEYVDAGYMVLSLSHNRTL